MTDELNMDVRVACGNCKHLIHRADCFCCKCGEPAPWLPLSSRRCKNCNTPDDPGWCDVVIPNGIWNEVFPEGGEWCFRCMTKRLVESGVKDVPVLVASGPYVDANETWRLIGIQHGRLIERGLMWPERSKLEPLQGVPEAITLTPEDGVLVARMASKKGFLAHGDTIQEALRRFCGVLDLMDHISRPGQSHSPSLDELTDEDLADLDYLRLKNSRLAMYLGSLPGGN